MSGPAAPAGRDGPAPRPPRAFRRLGLGLALSLAGVPPAAAVPVAPVAAPSPVVPANIIDGEDDRDSLLVLGPRLGLSPAEIARIRRASGYVGCLSPSPSVGAGALFIDDRQVLTAAHILFEPSGRRRSKCFFRTQDTAPVMVDLALDAENVRFGAAQPKAGSHADYAIVRLAAPIAGAEPFQPAAAPPVVGQPLIVVTAHPAGMRRAVDEAVPVVQSCTVRRVLAASFRTDCDATGSSSGGFNLARVGGRLVVVGITVTTGPWRNPRLEGAPYSEKRGSVTTALFAGGAVAAAGRSLAAAPWKPWVPPAGGGVAGALAPVEIPPQAPAGQARTGSAPAATPRLPSSAPGRAAERRAPPPVPRPADALGLGLDTSFAPRGPDRHDPLAPP